MNQHAWLANQFEQHRGRLRSVAQRMLGSSAEGEDAVQEAWLRLSRSDPRAIDNLGGWLTTVVARVCLDMLRARTSRAEAVHDLSAGAVELADASPEDVAMAADSVGAALQVVLESLRPAERMAFVLCDVFDVSHEEIGVILGRSANAAKQLASRARRKVRGAASDIEVDIARQREVIEAFLTASRHGDFAALISLLDPDVTLDADAAAVTLMAPQRLHGAEDVAGLFAGRAKAAQPALINSEVGLVWRERGRTKVVWIFTIDGGMIVDIVMWADPVRLADLDLQLLR